MPPPTIPPRLLLALALLLLAQPQAAADTSFVSGDYKCPSNEPPPAPGPGCLSRLADPLYKQEYEPCKNSTCYIFLQEPPFVSLDPVVFNDSPEAIDNQRPFPCGAPENEFRSLHGIAFELHKRTSSRNSLCMWGGHSTVCSFNALVNYTHRMAAQGYRFAVTGLLLETPQRQCHHDASAPFVDNSMIVIGRNIPERASTTGALHQLSRPFAWGTWLIFGLLVLLFTAVCVAIAIRFRIFRGRSLITAFFIFTGERDEALAHEMHLHGNNKDSAAQAMTFATKYGLSMTLYRLALIAFIGIFALFYEVAVVNFLFQKQSLSLTKSVKSLSKIELGEYSVLKHSALENVWALTVSKDERDPYGSGDDDVPWHQCDTATECIKWAAGGSHEAKFVVTFEVVGKYLLKTYSNCDDLTIFETKEGKDFLYQFNAGWLYNNQVEEEDRKQIDRELVALRINGTTRELIDEEIGDFSCTNAVKPDIGPMIILIPCLAFVIPPLLLSILVLLCWKRRRRLDEKRGQRMEETVRGSSSEQGDETSWSV